MFLKNKVIIMAKDNTNEEKAFKIGFKPNEMKAILDQYIIGQDEAKKTLCIAMYNHYKRVISNIFGVEMSDNTLDDVNIEKSNILLIGNTGTGKTYMLKTIAKMMGLPCYVADATRLTSAGYVGDDIETILTGLLQECNYNVEAAQMGIICLDEADKLARKGDNPSLTRDVGGESVQQGILKIIEGSRVGVPPQGGRKHPEQPLIYLDTSNILFVFMGSFEGLDKIIERRCNTNRIGFGESKKIDKENVLNKVINEDLKKYGFIPELIGRFPITVTTNDLTKEDLIAILKDTKNSIIKQYKKLMAIDEVNLNFTDESLAKIADFALETKTGARGLKKIMEAVLHDVMYDFSEYKGKTFEITEAYVIDKMQKRKAA